MNKHTAIQAGKNHYINIATKKLQDDINHINAFAAENGIDLEVFEERVSERNDPYAPPNGPTRLSRAYITSKPLGGLLAVGTPGHDERWKPIYPRQENSYPVKGNFFVPPDREINHQAWWIAVCMALDPKNNVPHFAKFDNFNTRTMTSVAERRFSCRSIALINLIKRRFSMESVWGHGRTIATW